MKQIKKYVVEIELIKKEYIEVDASSREEAAEKAYEKFYSIVESLDEDVRCLGIESGEDNV